MEKQNLTEEIRAELFRMQDTAYRDFQRKLIPTVPPETIIGVRTPALRRYAGELRKRAEIDVFLRDLPHRWFDENQLHAFLLSGMKDFARCAAEVERFLPWVDNWATCDQLSPGVFREHRSELLAHIRVWLRSDRPYTVRFAVGMLMAHFLDADFDPAYPALVAALRPGEYYIDMMRAWYFATGLAKQYDAFVPYLEERRLDSWTHNKAIQKAVESFRVSPEQKAYLKTLRAKREKK